MKYKLIRASSVTDLEWLLEDLLLKGWVPLGAPYYATDCHHQALTLDQRPI